MKTLVPLSALVLGLGLACAGSSDVETGDAAVDAPVTPAVPEAPVPAVEGEGTEVVVVPVPEDGAGANWCCEYTEGGVTKFTLVEGKTQCETEYADRSGRWTDGVQCMPCCCKSPNDAGNLDLGYSFELTTPGMCAGSGTCVPSGADTCHEDAEAHTPARPHPTGPITGTRSEGGISGTRPGAAPAPAPAPAPSKGKKGKND